MLSVALTGNIASGKSSVARLFERWGAHLIDADVIVRELQQPGTPVFQRIAERFGPDVIASDGTLDRAALRSRVFQDGRDREDLNAIVHPAVRARRDQLMAEARSAGAQVVVQDIPLLFETLDPGAFDLVVLVDAPSEVRRARLMEHRRLSQEEADRMMAAQLPASQKRPRSHFVIENDADLAILERRARVAWEQISRIAAERA